MHGLETIIKLNGTTQEELEQARKPITWGELEAKAKAKAKAKALKLARELKEQEQEQEQADSR